MKKIKSIIATLFLLATAAANAKELDYFGHKDWALSCDNVGTCYAEGYHQAENYQDDAEPSEPSAPISMLITRSAGAHSKVDIQVQYIPNWDQENYIYGDTGRFQIGEVKFENFDNKSGEWHLSDAQVRLVLPELLKQPHALITDGKTNWKLSLKGAKAVLLKMDEQQGRLSTPTALVQKGSNSEKQVLKPLPLPIIYAAATVKTKLTDERIKELIFNELSLSKDSGYNCNNPGDFDVSNLMIYRLTKNKVLLSYSCAAGAYNSTGLMWIANDRPPYQPQLLEAEGEYENGLIFGAWKGRGLGDCWSTKTWTFDGNGFVLTESGNDLCRGFPGGAWGIKQFVSKVVKK